MQSAFIIGGKRGVPTRGLQDCSVAKCIWERRDSSVDVVSYNESFVRHKDVLSAADGERHDLSPSKPREGHAEAVALLVGASADVLPGVRKDAQGKHQCIGALANQSDVDQISRRHRFDRDVKKGLALGSTASDYPRTLRRRRSMGRRRPSRHHLRDFGGDEQHPFFLGFFF
jgi:hypothetical protein